MLCWGNWKGLERRTAVGLVRHERHVEQHDAGVDGEPHLLPARDRLVRDRGATAPQPAQRQPRAGRGQHAAPAHSGRVQVVQGYVQSVVIVLQRRHGRHGARLGRTLRQGRGARARPGVAPEPGEAGHGAARRRRRPRRGGAFGENSLRAQHRERLRARHRHR